MLQYWFLLVHSFQSAVRTIPLIKGDLSSIKAESVTSLIGYTTLSNEYIVLVQRERDKTQG